MTRTTDPEEKGERVDDEQNRGEWMEEGRRKARTRTGHDVTTADRAALISRCQCEQEVSSSQPPVARWHLDHNAGVTVAHEI